MPSNNSAGKYDKWSVYCACSDEHIQQPCPKGCPCLCDPCMSISDKRKQTRVGRRSRSKGKKAQNAVKTILTQELGLSRDDLFGAAGGAKEDDIRGSAEFQEKFGFRIEVKNEKTIRMLDYIEQAEVDTHQLKSTKPWVVVFKIHGSSKFYATLKLTELMKLITAKKALEDTNE